MLESWRGRRTVLKRLLFALVLLLGLALLADRFLVSAAQDAAGRQVRSVLRTPRDAEVTIAGFPFLTQALGGRLRQVDVVSRGVPVEGLTLQRVDASLTGVRLEVGKALAGEIEGVPADTATATARLTYEDLNAYLRRRGSLVVSASGGTLSVAGQVRVKGAQFAGKGQAALVLRPGSIVLQVTSASADGVALPAAATRLLTVTVPTRGLPFGMSLQRVEIGQDALILRGAATGIFLSP